MSLGTLFRAAVIATAAASAPAQATDSVALAVRAAPRGAYTLELAADARRVDLAGDVTNWDTVPMKRTGTKTFVLTLRAAPGVHQVAVRLDGGAWRVPAGLAKVTDEFGGVAGVLVLPARQPGSGDARAEPGSPPRDSAG